MMKRIIVFCLASVLAVWAHPLHPYIQPWDNYYGGYSYAPYVQTYSSYLPTFTSEFVQNYPISEYSAIPQVQPSLNIIAESPYAISDQFSVVPLFVVSQNTINTIYDGRITAVSDRYPTMTVRLGERDSINCTPAVKMVLDQPIIVGSLKSDILFPAEVQIVHDGFRMPIRIGAVIAPVIPDVYVSQDKPVVIKMVYAVPTRPVSVRVTERNEPHMFAEGGFGALSRNPDYVNNEDAIVMPDQEAVVVEGEPELPPKNVTVIEFPTEEASPQLQVDEEDDELVNRNPPQFLAPAGIVQSTQPESHVEPFHNDKESPYLEKLRNEAKKRKKL